VRCLIHWVHGFLAHFAPGTGTHWVRWVQYLTLEARSLILTQRVRGFHWVRGAAASIPGAMARSTAARRKA
jgi:hypothetical protein